MPYSTIRDVKIKLGIGDTTEYDELVVKCIEQAHRWLNLHIADLNISDPILADIESDLAVYLFKSMQNLESQTEVARAGIEIKERALGLIQAVIHRYNKPYTFVRVNASE